MDQVLIDTYWMRYLATLPVGAPAQQVAYVAESFGDHPTLADELAALVLAGSKTATCSALWEWEAEGQPLPPVGLHTIVLDGQGLPVCIIETTEVTVRPFDQVDAMFAWEEGEGDRSLDDWRAAHWRYFTRTLPRIGRAAAPDMPLVCERFRLVYVNTMTQSVDALYSALYDVIVPDWPGEIAFYQTLARDAAGQDVLELACGTGRVTLPLAAAGVGITGLDLSTEMLARARAKSAGMSNVTWVQGDMRGFDLGRQFGLAIIPGHSFQFMLTPDDQVQCLQCIRRHLVPGGGLVVHLDHQDFDWLGGLGVEPPGQFEFSAPVIHPASGQMVRTAHAWTYAAATQTATVTTVWETIAADGTVLARWERPPMPLHCVFRCEMEHLLHRVGFVVDAVYGDFARHALADDSDSMVWVARHAA